MTTKREMLKARIGELKDSIAFHESRLAACEAELAALDSGDAALGENQEEAALRRIAAGREELERLRKLESEL